VSYLLKARIVELAETAIAREQNDNIMWPCVFYAVRAMIPTAAGMHATIEELWEEVFSVCPCRGCIWRIGTQLSFWVESLERVFRQTSPSLRMIWNSWPWWRHGRQCPHCCKSLCSNTELVVRQLLASKNVNMEAEGSVVLEAVTQQCGEDTADWEDLVCAVVNYKVWELAVAQ
jgi:hypothetical protein